MPVDRVSQRGSAGFRIPALRRLRCSSPLFVAFVPCARLWNHSRVEHLLSTIPITVTTLADDPTGPIQGKVTLRDAITAADAG